MTFIADFRSTKKAIVKAVKSLESEVFSVAKGGREGSNKTIVFMFTSPEPDDVRAELRAEVKRLHDIEG